MKAKIIKLFRQYDESGDGRISKVARLQSPDTALLRIIGCVHTHVYIYI